MEVWHPPVFRAAKAELVLAKQTGWLYHEGEEKRCGVNLNTGKGNREGGPGKIILHGEKGAWGKHIESLLICGVGGGGRIKDARGEKKR